MLTRVHGCRGHALGLPNFCLRALFSSLLGVTVRITRVRLLHFDKDYTYTANLVPSLMTGASDPPPFANSRKPSAPLSSLTLQRMQSLNTAKRSSSLQVPPDENKLNTSLINKRL